jgi:hypothetical protein
MTTDLERVHADLSAFADDDEDVVLDSTGALLLVRNGQDITGRLVENAERRLMVEVEGERLTYSRFLTHHLARLDVFAERLLAKRSAPTTFIDGPARLDTAREDPIEGSALSLLTEECREGSPFATRVAFITADAGHGKTILLRQHQHAQAEAFLAGTTPYLFWHVDLQGRQLVRLSEALMGDLGDLRVTGLWMPAILKLIQRRVIVLAIDGFDELAAEQGSTDALGALAMLVRQLDGHGVVVAASRRTFFDTEDYLARAGLLRRSVAAACEFDQIALDPWSPVEVRAFFEDFQLDGKRLDDPDGTLDALVSVLGGDDQHPMLTRPFLVNQLARALTLYDTTPADFVRGMDDPLKGVAALVQAFVQREVAEKWIHRESGEPYLTVDQHMEFLAAVADEMYQAQRDRLSLDIVETIAALHFDKWEIEPEKRVKCMQMVRMHVLLTIPPDGASDSRAFDHTEFKDYFVAYSLRSQLAEAAEGESPTGLGQFLSTAQLSDGTARYVCAMLDLSEERAANLVRCLAKVGRDEWKPTFLHTNIGTIFPFVVDGRDFVETIEFDGKPIFSSLVFEGKRLSNVTIREGTFLNASFVGTELDRVRFVRCVFGEPTVDLDATIHDVYLEECELSGVRVVRGDEEITREFAPSRVQTALVDAGFSLHDAAPLPLIEVEESNLHKQVRRTLSMFHRTTIINERGLQQRFRGNFNFVLSEVIPLLERHGVVEPRPWHGSGSQGVWALACSLDELLAGDEPVPDGPFAAFWADVASSA